MGKGELQSVMAAGKERNVTGLLRKMQQAAVLAPGYVSSEAFKDNANDQKLLVISSWHSEADWKAWQASPERKEVDAELKAFVATNGAPHAFTVRVTRHLPALVPSVPQRQP